MGLMGREKAGRKSVICNEKRSVGAREVVGATVDLSEEKLAAKKASVCDVVRKTQTLIR